MVARNLLIPFRRDRKRDLATGEAEALLASKVRQVLLTEGATARSSGELPWRTNFGAGLGLARHRPNDAVLAELTRVQVRDALQRWLPGVAALEIDVAASGEILSMRVRVREGATTVAVTTEW
jgi:hypothetical protein